MHHRVFQYPAVLILAYEQTSQDTVRALCMQARDPRRRIGHGAAAALERSTLAAALHTSGPSIQRESPVTCFWQPAAPLRLYLFPFEVKSRTPAGHKAGLPGYCSIPTRLFRGG